MPLVHNMLFFSIMSLDLDPPYCLLDAGTLDIRDARRAMGDAFDPRLTLADIGVALDEQHLRM